MAVQTMSNVSYGYENDMASIYFTLASVTDGDTVVIPGITKLTDLSILPSTSAGVGGTYAVSSGILTVTLKVSTGTPNLICKATGIV